MPFPLLILAALHFAYNFISRFWCCSQCCSPVLFQVWPSLNVSTFLIVSKFCTGGVLPHCDVQMLKEIKCIKETQTRSTLILYFFSDPTPLWSKRPIQSNITVTNIILQSKFSVTVKQCCKQTEWKHCCQCVAGATLKSILSVSSCQDQVVACSVACQCVADAIQVVDFISVITNCVKYGSLLTDPFLQTV